MIPEVAASETGLVQTMISFAFIANRTTVQWNCRVVRLRRPCVVTLKFT